MAYGKILTGLLDHFLDRFFWTIFFAVYQYSGGVRGRLVTEGGVEDELLVRRKGWEVVVLVNATDYRVFSES